MTTPNTQEVNKWESEFEQLFDSTYRNCGVGYGSMQVGLKAFIRKTITTAVADREEEIADIIKIRIRQGLINHAESSNANIFYKQGLQELLSITHKEDLSHGTE